MKALAALVAGFLMVVGCIGLLAPEHLLNLARHTLTPTGLYLVAALRVAAGIVLLRVARASRAPNALRALGVIALVAGLATPVLGLDRARSVLEWWASHETSFMRLGAVLPIGLGGLVLWAVSGRPRASTA